MRIQYPNEIDTMIESIEDYLVFDGHEYVVAENAPAGTKEKLDSIRTRMKEFREKEGI